MTRTAQDTVGTMALPFGLALAKGIGLKTDDKKQEGTLEFSTCQAAGCMVPVAFDAKALEALKTGTTLKIHSLGSDANLLGKPVTSVSLVGYEGHALTWRQEADGLVIVCPPEMPFATAVAFNIR